MAAPLLLAATLGAATLFAQDRAEQIHNFETYVYGHDTIGRPHDMTWQVVAEDRHGMGGKAVTKTVKLYFSAKKDGPAMELGIMLPVSSKPVPAFLIAGNARLNPTAVLNRGYGVIACRVDQIQSDAPNGYARSIRGFFAPPGQTEPGPEEWGAIGAWAWGLSRAMDYIETDKEIDSKRIALNGAMRYGRIVLWAGARDQRFAMTIAHESGFVETVVQVANGRFSYWLDRKLKGYTGDAASLPVDWAKLIALHAPRPIYIATPEESGPEEMRASLECAKSAEPAYARFGKPGMGGFIGYHTRPGEHLQSKEDWEYYLKFADRHFGAQKK